MKRETIQNAFVCLLSLCILLGLTACSLPGQSPTGMVTDTESPDSAAGSSPEPDTADTESGLQLLHVNITTDYTLRSLGRDDGWNDSVWVSADEIHLTQADALQYPQLEQGLVQRNETFAAYYADVLEELYQSAVSDGENGQDYELNYCYEVESQLRRADRQMLSIFESVYTYGGGAHPYYACLGANFDPVTGKEMTLADVITDLDAFKATVKEKLYEQYPNIEFMFMDDFFAGIDGTDNTALPWTMDYFGITLYFNPYVLASYAEGMQVVTLTFAEAQELFREAYLQIPQDYVQQLDSAAPAMPDVNGDGTAEPVYVTWDYTESSGDDSLLYCGSDYLTWNVNCGGESLSITDWSYSGDFYLICSGGKYYVAILEQSDNDYSQCTVVDLQTMSNDAQRAFGASLPLVEAVYGSECEMDGYTSCVTVQAWTVTEGFRLASRLDTLGTLSGSRAYQIGTDGWPVPQEDWYLTSTNYALCPRQDILCNVVDENGRTIGEGTLITGQYYQQVRTDGSTWVDVQKVEGEVETEDYGSFVMARTSSLSELNPDAAIYRLDYDNSQWPYLVNGISEEEAFSGMMYAG